MVVALAAVASAAVGARLVRAFSRTVLFEALTRAVVFEPAALEGPGSGSESFERSALAVLGSGSVALAELRARVSTPCWVVPEVLVDVIVLAEPGPTFHWSL